MSTITVADIFRRHLEPGAALSAKQWKVANAIMNCRTAVLGGHLTACDACGYQEPRWHSCRDRHCPQCQSMASSDWLDARRAEILPVTYFHVVFTMPHVLNGIVRMNKELCYRLLFDAASGALGALCRDHLGGQAGFMAVLHTWDQRLGFHPHIHMVVPGGVLAEDGMEWKPVKNRWFLPVEALSEVFRGRMLRALEQAGERGALEGGRHHTPEQHRRYLKDTLVAATRTPWAVYCKPSFKTPESVLGYLARYTHRIAISNDRLISLDGGMVRFAYKDRKANGRSKRVVASMRAEDFIQRFLEHVLPPGFTRIRYYGFLAGPLRSRSLAQIRDLLRLVQSPRERYRKPVPWEERFANLMGQDPRVCPKCRKGRMVDVAPLSGTLRPHPRKEVAVAATNLPLAASG
jgi:hypothetical protein